MHVLRTAGGHQPQLAPLLVAQAIGVQGRPRPATRPALLKTASATAVAVFQAAVPCCNRRAAGSRLHNSRSVSCQLTWCMPH